jgi:DNA mismatch repair ATPase MutS
MAGKSTFMKAFGIALYLAHLGFPVPADKMEFTPMEGMFTSINVPDDISQGYSHFYAEVMRVKNIAKEVASGKRLMVIFDELFKGTNVKDAYDGTVAITEAFSKCGKCVFIVSTHIMEAGVTLKEQTQNIQFSYLPTVVVNDRPTYTYKLTDGIADDRHGMRIINNERIIEIIKGVA